MKIKQHSAEYHKAAEKTKSLGYGLHALHKSKAETGKLQELTKSTVVHVVINVHVKLTVKPIDSRKVKKKCIGQASYPYVQN